MIDKARSIEAFIELIDCINEGKVKEIAVEFILRNGTKVSCPVENAIRTERPGLKVIQGEKDKD